MPFVGRGTSFISALLYILHQLIALFLSPELIQNSMRDFSVYVLDPLESMSPSGSSTSAPNDPRGVAIGLGLMSWALLADEDDPVEVTGTVIKQGNGMGALEVIFSLKEVSVSFGTFVPIADSIVIRRHICKKHPYHQHLSLGVSIPKLPRWLRVYPPQPPRRNEINIIDRFQLRQDTARTPLHLIPLLGGRHRLQKSRALPHLPQTYSA